MLVAFRKFGDVLERIKGYNLVIAQTLDCIQLSDTAKNHLLLLLLLLLLLRLLLFLLLFLLLLLLI